MSNDEQWSQNFVLALNKLEEFCALPIVTERDRAGILQAFEFTFEQCWKAFQKIAPSEGVSADTPRQALQAALRMGLINVQDEESWLNMMRDRNLTSHLYQETLAQEVTERVTGCYLQLFQNTLSRIRARGNL